MVIIIIIDNNKLNAILKVTALKIGLKQFS